MQELNEAAEELQASFRSQMLSISALDEQIAVRLLQRTIVLQINTRRISNSSTSLAKKNTGKLSAGCTTRIPGKSHSSQKSWMKLDVPTFVY